MTNFLVESWTYLTIDLVVVFLRTFARWKTLGFRSLAWDDYLMVLAGLLYTAETATAHYVGAYWFGLANSGMSEEERKNLDPASLEYHFRVKGSQTQLFGWLVYTVLLWTLKCCWLFFYTRLGEGVTHMALKVKIGFVFVISTFLGTFGTILLKCQPISLNWQIYPNPGNTCQPAVSKVQAYTLITTNLATDVYIMLIPMPMVWSARIPPLHKLGLIGMFCGGIFTAVAGLFRCIFVLLDRPNGPELTGEWSCRESFIAVLISNIPVLYPIIRGIYKTARNTVNSHSRSKSRSQSGVPGDGKGTNNTSKGGRSYKMSTLSKPSRKKDKFKHPLSLPGETFYERFGSEEDIMGLDGKLHTNTEGGKGLAQLRVKPSTDDIMVTREFNIKNEGI